MKKLFQPHSGADTRDIALLVLRLVIASLLITHGLPKFQKIISGEPIQFVSVMGMSQELSLFLAMFAEFICSIFVMVGFATRLSTIPIIFTMAVIFFSIHGDDPIGKKELPLMYLIGFLGILLMGAGRYSIDNLLHRRFQKASN